MIMINSHLYFHKNNNGEWKIVNTKKRIKLEIYNKNVIKVLNEILLVYKNEEVVKADDLIIELLLVTMITTLEKEDLKL